MKELGLGRKGLEQMKRFLTVLIAVHCMEGNFDE